jgi:SAM-dependent methyltransferase
MSFPTKDGFHSRAARKDTFHTLSLIQPHLRSGDTVLEIGCSNGYLAGELAQRHRGPVLAVDIVDCRIRPTPHFALYDGIHLPFDDASCDVVNLSFTLHHIPNETKPSVIAEVRRVVRRIVIVTEDTPRNAIDRYFNRRHGEEFRRSIGSTAGFGFYSQKEWETFFPAHGLAVKQAKRIGRFERDWQQPFARTCFVLERM